jgi:hypothetical protein
MNWFQLFDRIAFGIALGALVVGGAVLLLHLLA